MTLRHATALETVFVVVPEHAMEAYEAALSQACGTVGFFMDDETGLWTIEGVKDQGDGEADLASALAVAETVTGFAAPLQRHATESDGWLARTFEAFPEQLVGRRFAVRGTHLSGPAAPGRLTIVLDAAIAFGSGEHGSTRGCLRALERVAHREPRRILDLGTGSGILAMGAAKLLHRRVLATDIDPWSVRVTRDNARRNGLARQVRALRADGWASPTVRGAARYDLIFANILARPLTRMARHLSHALAPGGTAILAGLLETQARWVLGAHRHHGLVLERTVREGAWTTLVLRRRAPGDSLSPRRP
jgi:ribosomal protein L11 methyltransferase